MFGVASITKDTEETVPEYSMKQAIKIAVRFLINRLPVRFKRYLLSILSTDSRLFNYNENRKPAHKLVLEALGYVEAGNERQAEEILLEALPLDPASVAPHLSRVRFMEGSPGVPFSENCGRGTSRFGRDDGRRDQTQCALRAW